RIPWDDLVLGINQLQKLELVSGRQREPAAQQAELPHLQVVYDARRRSRRGGEVVAEAFGAAPYLQGLGRDTLDAGAARVLPAELQVDARAGHERRRDAHLERRGRARARQALVTQLERAVGCARTRRA